MRKLPVFSTDAELNTRVSTICQKFYNRFSPVFFDNEKEALEFIKYELPEVNIINFSDRKLDGFSLLASIKSDPWLHYGGIIGVHAGKDEAKLSKEMPDSNILSLIPRSHFVRNFIRLLKILIQNRQIVFHRELQSFLLKEISGSLVMDNDPFNAGAYANLITNYLYNSNYINKDMKERLHLAIFEMLLNAIEHGNCRISYEEKSQWLEAGNDILDLIREKCRDPEVRGRRVNFTYRITPQRSYYVIRDQGEGFDWKSRIQPEEGRVNLSSHGHGIRMTDHYMQNLQYNERGNKVSFELPHENLESNIIPGIFEGQEEAVFNDKEYVFKEGEESNFLYYIVSGKLDVYSGDKYLTTLTPADIFLGEMSFLLNNRRSANVLAKGKTVLIRISKNSFVNLIKDNPHYGIFLARLLAGRLSKLNSYVARLK
jgi:anti-sigma regulatory factor (Ser/Thr protein kinase)